MTINLNRDRVVAIVAVLAAALLPLSVQLGWLTAEQAEQAGSILAALGVGYHTPNARQANASAAVAALSTPTPVHADEPPPTPVSA